MAIELKEGNGIAALAPSIKESAGVAVSVNGATVIGATLSAIASTDEAWINQDIVAVVQPENRAIVPMDEAEERRILSHPDVVEGVEKALREVEAWERA